MGSVAAVHPGVAQERRLQITLQAHELCASQATPPEQSGEVIDRTAAIAAKAVPAALGLLEDVQARSLIIVKRAADLPIAPGGRSAQALDILARSDLEQRIALVPVISRVVLCSRARFAQRRKMLHELAHIDAGFRPAPQERHGPGG